MDNQKQVQLTLFDYGQLDSETRIAMKQRAERINERTRRAAHDIWENGREFYEAQQELAQHGYGCFGEWAESETGYSRSAVYKCINVYENFDCVKFTQSNIAASALYLLAAPSTPDEARQEAIRRVESGERITHKAAKEIVNDRKYHVEVHGFDNLPATPNEQTLEAVAISDQSAKMDVHYSSKTPEHFTPNDVIEAVIECMGGIDLDPCSNSKTSPNIPAEHHFTIEDDGLSQEWFGRVYMNPPYGREIEDWVEKLCEEHKMGRVTEAIVLVPSRTDTQWWLKLRDYVRCEVEGRLVFIGNGNSAPFPSSIWYLGNDIDKFFYVFNNFGDIWQRLEPGMFAQ